MGPVWPSDARALEVEQLRLAALRPPLWTPPADGLSVAGCFLAFARGQQGPGQAGDLGWAAAAVIDCGTGQTLSSHFVPCAAGARYEAGRLALREGPALAAAVQGLAVRPDVLMVDATGRDHPRGAGLALHLGAVCDLPSVGVTHRTLLARGGNPGAARGATAALTLDGQVVGAWLRTRVHARPVAVHAGWRTDTGTALLVALACTAQARTPEPIRRARVLARTARAHAEGRTAQAWRNPLA